MYLAEQYCCRQLKKHFLFIAKSVPSWHSAVGIPSSKWRLLNAFSESHVGHINRQWWFAKLLILRIAFLRLSSIKISLQPSSSDAHSILHRNWTSQTEVHQWSANYNSIIIMIFMNARSGRWLKWKLHQCILPVQTAIEEIRALLSQNFWLSSCSLCNP